MRIFYLPETPFGEFFYDPQSHQGVAISESGLVILSMASDFNPAMQPDYMDCEVADDVFPKFIDAVLRYHIFLIYHRLKSVVCEKMVSR